MAATIHQPAKHEHQTIHYTPKPQPRKIRPLGDDFICRVLCPLRHPQQALDRHRAHLLAASARGRTHHTDNHLAEHDEEDTEP